MLKRYPKGEHVKISQNFCACEFKCHCERAECKDTFIRTDLISSLEALRVLTGGPVTVTSGYRCHYHNARVSKAEFSQHPKGTAADVKTPVSPADTAARAEEVPAFKFGGIGLYDDFVHVDVRGHRARWNSSTKGNKK